MRLLSINSHQQPIGVPSVRAATAFLMFLHIATTIILTLTDSSTYAASLSSITNRARHRTKLRSIRATQNTTKELGERNCSEKEKQTQGCLAGSCAALVTSQLHTFIICRCPSDRQGARCEEIAINTDSIAEVLKEQTQEELCKQERYDLLAKSLGYESLFLECVNRNYQLGFDSQLSEKEKMRNRRQKKKERERRRRKLRKRRQRERDKKKGQRSAERATASLGIDIDIRDSLQNSNAPGNFSNLLMSPKDLPKRAKDHTGHNHKIRHEGEKSSSRRRRKSLTTFLVGTPTALTPTVSPKRKRTGLQQ